MLYYVFPTLPQAEAAVTQMNSVMTSVAVAHGFVAVPGGVVGKNAATGEDDPTATLTSTWATPEETADHQWAIPSCRTRFPTSYPQIEDAANLPEPEEVVFAPEEASE